MIIVNFDLEPLGLGGQGKIRIFLLQLIYCWDLLVSDRLILLLHLIFFIWRKIRIRFFIG